MIFLIVGVLIKMVNKNKQIKKHESEYYHIPKLKGNPWCILLTFIFGMLSYFNFKLIISIFKFVDLANPFGDLFEESIKGVHQLIVIYPILFEYVFIILTLIFLVGIFKKLKRYNEEGLIVGLIWGLIVGLIVGIAGLIGGLIVGLIAGLIGGLIAGLIAGLILGIAGLIAGLVGELN